MCAVHMYVLHRLGFVGPTRTKTSIPSTAQNARARAHAPEQPQRFYFVTFFHASWMTVVLRILDFLPARGNPWFYQCMLDEDLIRRVAHFAHRFCMKFCLQHAVRTQLTNDFMRSSPCCAESTLGFLPRGALNIIAWPSV